MALVDRRGLTRQDLPAVAASRAAAKKQRRHRVIIENVEQKQLKTTISFQVRPPNGYTFIPAGNPDLTTALKEASRDANQQIYAVSASPHAQVHDLSKEVHRIGFHFPTIIVAQVCQAYGITLTSKGQVADDNADTFRQMRQNGGRNNVNNNEKKKDQKTVNTEAKLAIMDLFPKIPKDDLYTIIKGAFQKGQKKVGTANELSLVRRAQLSVVAHVRHVYTKYDKLLRTVGYREARAQVENPTLKKLVEWRGDDDNTNDGKNGLEDVMREVIVLSDDEDSDDDADDDADDVVEVVSTRENAWPLPTHQSIEYSHPLSPRQYHYQSGDDNVPGYRVFAQPSRRRRLVDGTPQNQASTPYRQSRYAAWDRAREEYRANPSTAPSALVPLSQHDPKFYYQEQGFNFNDPPKMVRQGIIETRRPERYPGYTDRQVVHERRPVELEVVRLADGHLYERTITQPQQALIPQRRQEMTQAYVSSQPPSPRHVPLHEGYDPRVQPINSQVLPSIEDNQPPSLGDSRSRVPQYDARMAPPRRSDGYPPSDARTRKVQVIDLTEGGDTQITQRHRVEEPLRARQVVDFNLPRRPPGQLVTQDGFDRPARELQYHDREIIDLSSPKYVRDPVPASPRVVSDRRPVDSRTDGHGIPSDARTPRPLVEVPHNIPISRYAYGSDPARDQNLGSGFLPPQRVQLEGQTFHGAQRRQVKPPDENYHLGDLATRSEHLVDRHTARVPVYDGGSISYSREYIPVIRNDVLMPDRAAQQPLPIYADPARGPQHDRYERMPPPTYVRN